MRKIFDFNGKTHPMDDCNNCDRSLTLCLESHQALELTISGAQYHRKLCKFRFYLNFLSLSLFLFHSISDREWGLPLAIAANLHLPYRIKIGLDGFTDFHNMDAFDRRKYNENKLKFHFVGQTIGKNRLFQFFLRLGFFPSEFITFSFSLPIFSAHYYITVEFP